ncbi:MAG: GntR family transcriptional regulator [Bacillota bacterium]|nr:GntR family transcriptional regulator [Bacillota bacterium]
MTLFEQNGNKPLGDLVFDYLRKQILSGELKPGERLMEVELSEELGVSRTPVREAMRKLQKEKFVVMYPRRGTYVADLKKADVIQVLEVRKDLEGFAAYLAAARMTREELEELRAMMHGFEDALARDDRKQMIHYDNAFHNSVLKGTKNIKLMEIIEDLQDQFQRFRLQYFQEMENFAEIQQAHKRIFDAVRGGNPLVARDEAEQHVESISERVKQWIDN